MRLVIISGVSGGGKSTALRALEDLGYFAVDNLPLALLPSLVNELATGGAAPVERAAVVVDVRDPRQRLDDFETLMAATRDHGAKPEVLFLAADRDVLIARYSETRRRHPLSGGERSLREALEHEARLLDPVRERAARVIDTTQSNVHGLRRLIQDQVGRATGDGMALLLQSFGYKYAAPHDTDMQFDVRCLPNPYWERELRALTGRDAAVREFLGASEAVQDMLASLEQFLVRWVPQFERENRAYLGVAIGCTGGRHRSVYIVDELSRRLRAVHGKLLVRHRELDGESTGEWFIRQ